LALTQKLQNTATSLLRRDIKQQGLPWKVAR
jgi:hypothetical protein